MKTIEYNTVLAEKWGIRRCVLLWYEDMAGAITLMKIDLQSAMGPQHQAPMAADCAFFPAPIRRALLIVPDGVLDLAYIVNVFDGKAIYYTGEVELNGLTNIVRLPVDSVNFGGLRMISTDINALVSIKDYLFLIATLTLKTNVSEQYK